MSSGAGSGDAEGGETRRRRRNQSAGRRRSGERKRVRRSGGPPPGRSKGLQRLGGQRDDEADSDTDTEYMDNLIDEADAAKFFAQKKYQTADAPAMSIAEYFQRPAEKGEAWETLQDLEEPRNDQNEEEGILGDAEEQNQRETEAETETETEQSSGKGAWSSSKQQQEEWVQRARRRLATRETFLAEREQRQQRKKGKHRPEEHWYVTPFGNKTPQEMEEMEDKQLTANAGRMVGGFTLCRGALDLEEEDLIERFTKGSGKGGQKVNKTTNCVQLTHALTGTQVKCHETRDLNQNRKLARKRMADKLEQLVMGKDSRTQLKINKLRKKKSKQRSRAKAKYGKQGAEEGT